MKTIKANNYSQAVKEMESLDKDQVAKVNKEINFCDRKHNHVVAVKVSDRPGEVKNEVSVNTIIVNDDKLKKLNKNFKFLGFTKLIILHDASQYEEDETPVLHVHDKQGIEAKIKAELEAKNKAEIDALRQKFEADVIEAKKVQPQAGKEPEINVLEVYANELDKTVDELKAFATANEIDLTGLKAKEAIQLAIGTWMLDQTNEQ